MKDLPLRKILRSRSLPSEGGEKGVLLVLCDCVLLGLRPLWRPEAFASVVLLSPSLPVILNAMKDLLDSSGGTPRRIFPGDSSG